MKKGKSVGDLGMTKNREIIIMRHEKEIMQAKLNIQNQKIRILELQEEIAKAHTSIELLNGSIKEYEKYIKDERDAINNPEPEPEPEKEKK